MEYGLYSLCDYVLLLTREKYTMNNFKDQQENFFEAASAPASSLVHS